MRNQSLSSVTLAGLAAVAALTLAAAPALAQGYEVGALRVVQPWVRTAPPGAPTLAGYLSITNRGSSVDHLLGGSSPELSAIEVHEMSMTGQVMRMRPMVGGLAIDPGKTVVLTPGGERHLMLIGPKHAYKSGDRIPATLRFEKAGTVKVTFLVHDLGGRITPPMHPMRMP
jgi:copper(I)-binding protein